MLTIPPSLIEPDRASRLLKVAHQLHRSLRHCRRDGVGEQGTAPRRGADAVVQFLQAVVRSQR